MMKKMTMMVLMLLATSSLGGCWLFEKPSDLDASYLSGNLGNYADCPDQAAMTSPSNSSEPSAERAAPGPGLVAGDIAECPEGETCNYAPLNCSDAQLTIQVSNGGDDAAQGVRIKEILLLKADGTVERGLPVLSTVNADDNQPFDGNLAPGQSVKLRVEFQGPEGFSSWGSDQKGARLRVIIDSQTDEEIELETEELYGQPIAVT